MRDSNFCWGAVVKLGVEALVDEPPHPFQRRQLDLLDGPRRAALLDQFGLEQGELGCSHGLVLTVSFGPDRWCPAEFNNPVHICQGHIIGSAVGVMHQTREVIGDRSCCHVQSLPRQHVGFQGGGDGPGDNFAGEHVGDRRHIRKPLLCRDIRSVSNPELVRAIRLEPPLHPFGRIGIVHLIFRGERCSSPSHASHPAGCHQPRDLVPNRTMRQGASFSRPIAATVHKPAHRVS